jgi:hypothetical protein
VVQAAVVAAAAQVVQQVQVDKETLAAVDKEIMATQVVQAAVVRVLLVQLHWCIQQVQLLVQEEMVLLILIVDQQLLTLAAAAAVGLTQAQAVQAVVVKAKVHQAALR